jgi:hypothetical protein
MQVSLVDVRMMEDEVIKEVETEIEEATEIEKENNLNIRKCCTFAALF